MWVTLSSFSVFQDSSCDEKDGAGLVEGGVGLVEDGVGLVVYFCSHWRP